MATIYASAPGTGSGGSGTSGSPYTGLHDALHALFAESPGSILKLKAGTYTKGASWNSVTWGVGTVGARYYIEPETFTADTTRGVPGGTTSVIWNPSSGGAINITLPTSGGHYISFRGITFNGENCTEAGGSVTSLNYLASNIEYRNCLFKNHGRNNIGGGVRQKVSAMDFGVTNNSGLLMNNQVRYCLFDYDVTSAGLGCEHYIYCHQSGGVFEYNRFTSQTPNQPDIAIQFFATNSSVINNNIVRFNQFDNLGSGHSSDSVVLFSQRCSDNYVYGNVFYGCDRRAIDGRGGSGITGTTTGNIWAYNTIFDCETGIIIQDAAFTGTVIKNNIAYSCTTNYSDGGTSTDAATNGFDGTDPDFVGSGAGDFTLDTGSPYLTGGTELGSPFEDADFVGVIRENRSYGAFEDDAGTTPEPPINVYANPGGYTITKDMATVIPGLSVTQAANLVVACWLSLEGTNATWTDVDTSEGGTSN